MQHTHAHKHTNTQQRQQHTPLHGGLQVLIRLFRLCEFALHLLGDRPCRAHLTCMRRCLLGQGSLEVFELAAAALSTRRERLCT
jgi:hypothetical protein